MFTENERISGRQLFRKMIMGLIGIYLTVVPVIPEIRGLQGILALLLVMVIYLFAGIWFVRMKAIFQDPERYLGKIVGKLLIFLYLILLWSAGVFLLHVTAGITAYFLIEDSITWAVILSAGIVTYLGSHQGAERRARMAEVCFPVLFVLLAGMMLFVLPGIKMSYLLEDTGVSIRGLIRGSIKIAGVFLPFFLFPFALGKVEKAGKSWKYMAGSVSFLTMFLIAALILLQGIFGLGGYEHKQYPMIDLMAGVRLPGDFIQRVDVFWASALLFSMLFSLGSVFFYNYELLKRIKLEKAAVILAIGIIAAACLTGCGVPLEDRAFPLEMSADYRNGKYEIRYGIPPFSGTTGQDKNTGQAEDAQSVGYTGKILKEAEKKFHDNREKYIDTGHMKALILGYGILENKEAYGELLQFLEEKPSVGAGIYVFASREIPALMSLDDSQSVGEKLTGIMENHQKKDRRKIIKLQDLYSAFHRKEERPELPEVYVVNKKPQMR